MLFRSLVPLQYRKPAHTQRYIQWNSNHPKSCLLGVFKALIHRAFKLCDEKEDLISELDLLKKVFIQNEYPQKIVERIVKESWETELKSEMESLLRNGEEKAEEEKEFYTVLQVPYIKSFTESLQKELRKLNIGVVMKRMETLETITSNMRPETREDEQKNMIYGIECSSCKMMYVGETEIGRAHV